jgi:hypothetical protein
MMQKVELKMTNKDKHKKLLSDINELLHKYELALCIDYHEGMICITDDYCNEGDLAPTKIGRESNMTHLTLKYKDL